MTSINAGPSTSIPPVPPLSPSPGPDGGTKSPERERERTNTLALLLPHLSLFQPPSLRLLKEHYSSFGQIVHWAPVKGFGRVIIVYSTDEEAAYAKKEGDRLFLDVDLGEEEERKRYKDTGISHKRTKSQPPHGLLLRLHPMPPTPLDVDPSSSHLAPPVSDKNFLISPPGSPPEGWQPILEDAPNSQTLADDLHRALEGLVLNGMRRQGGKEVIVEGGDGHGGVRVEVEDTSLEAEDENENENGDGSRVRGKGGGGGMGMGMMDVDEEHEKGEVYEGVEHEGTWTLPSQSLGNGSGSGMRIAPTARPPL